MARVHPGLVAVLALLLASPAAAVPPPTDYPTDVLIPYVPAGWIMSEIQGGPNHLELGEFTPTGVPTQTFTDLVGYTVMPSATPITRKLTLHELADGGVSAQCTSHSSRLLQPAKTDPEWLVVEHYCLLKYGPAAGQVDLTFSANRVRPHALFTIWRAWRGSPEAFRAFLKATAKIDAAGVVSKDGQLSFDEAVLDRATPGILAAWSDTFTKAEVCDLALGELCPAYRTPQGMQPAIAVQAGGLGVIGQLHLAGAHDWTYRQAVQQMAKMSGANGEIGRKLLQALDASNEPTPGASFGQSVRISNHDFSRPEGMVAALLQPVLGAHVDGGDLVILDDTPPADPALRARLQAYLVETSHIAWLFKIPPERVSVTLYPPKP